MEDEKLQKCLETVENYSPQLFVFTENDTSVQLIEIGADGT
jgi:alpha-L-fucosidase